MTGAAISFRSGDGRCAGLLFRAEGTAFSGEDGRGPCVVLAHGLSLTVDSGLVPFAERFAEAGINAFAFDFRHLGASPGEPRQLVDVATQLEDLAAAVTYVRETDGVDPERIVLWGTSFSAGLAIAAAIEDPRIAAVVAQTPVVDVAAQVAHAARTAGPRTVARLTAAGMRDKLAAARGRAPVVVPAAGPPGSVAAMASPDALPGIEAIAGPSWRNEICARLFAGPPSFRPGRHADRLPCPILFQLADKDTIAPVTAAQDAAWRATGRAEVRTYPIGHFDVYTGAPFEKAVRDQLHFLRRHLGGRGERRSAGRQSEQRAQRAAAAE